MSLVYYVGDSAEWVEEKHPRDPDGKFATSGAASAPGIKLGSAIKEALNLSGFQKIKSKDETAFLHKESGLKVVIHLPKGSSQSSKFTIAGSNSYFEGEGKKALEYYFKKLAANAKPKPLSYGYAQSELDKDKMSLAKELGFSQVTWQNPDGTAIKAIDSHGNHLYYNFNTDGWVLNGDIEGSGVNQLKEKLSKSDPGSSTPIKDTAKKLLGPEWTVTQSGKLNTFTKGGETLNITELGGAWGYFNDLGEVVATGNDIGSLSAALLEGKFDKPESPPVKAPHEDLLTLKGYNNTKQKGSNLMGSTIFEKPGGAKVEFSPQGEYWIAQTPGHKTKEGMGIGELAKLFKGEAGSYKNSNKTISTGESVSEAGGQYTKSHLVIEQKLKEHAPVPNASQRGAIGEYCGSGYHHMNEKLRHDPKKAAESTAIQQLKTYLDGAELPEDVTLYRKVDGEYAKIIKSSMDEGCTFVERGFFSTSVSESAWHGSLKFKINAPKGTKGAAVGKISPHKGEHEVLLNAGTKFRVDSIHWEKNLIEVTVISSGGGNVEAKMREYTPKELDWEYEREYKHYAEPHFPGAFTSREDFQKKYDSSERRTLTDKEFQHMANSMADAGIGKGEEWVHKKFGHRRDTKAIIDALKSGETAPPIVLKKGNTLHLMAGQTRLAAAAAIGMKLPVKIIEV